MLEVEQVRDVRTQLARHVAGHPQPGRQELSDEYQERMARALGPVRVCMAAEQLKGPDILLPLYTALGTRMHIERRGREQGEIEAVLAEALAEVGLPAVVGRGGDVDRLRRRTGRVAPSAGMDPVGNDVGTPVIHFNGKAIFGPVVTPAPKGDAAGRLWDGVLACTGTEGFFELKRTRDQRPAFD